MTKSFPASRRPAPRRGPSPRDRRDAWRARGCEKMAGEVQGRRAGASSQDGRESGEIRLQRQGRSAPWSTMDVARRWRASGIASKSPARELVPLYREAPRRSGPRPKGRPRVRREGARRGRASRKLEARAAQARGAGGVPKKIPMALRAELRSQTGEGLAVAELSGLRHDACPTCWGRRAGQVNCYYARARRPDQARLRAKIAGSSGGSPAWRRAHRQMAMELRAVDGDIVDKTVLKVMNEMGLRCGIAARPTTTGTAPTKGSSARPSRTCSGATSPPTGPGRR